MRIINTILEIKKDDAELIKNLMNLPGIREIKLQEPGKAAVAYDSDLINKTDLEEAAALFHALK